MHQKVLGHLNHTPYETRQLIASSKGGSVFRLLKTNMNNVNQTLERHSIILTKVDRDPYTLRIIGPYFEDPTPVIQVQTPPLEGPRSLG